MPRPPPENQRAMVMDWMKVGDGSARYAGVEKNKVILYASRHEI
jgi:hypothetical protein